MGVFGVVCWRSGWRPMWEPVVAEEEVEEC